MGYSKKGKLMKKRLLAVIMSLALIITFMPVAGYAMNGWEIVDTDSYFQLKDREPAYLKITVDISGVTDEEAPEFQYEWFHSENDASFETGTLNEANNYTEVLKVSEPGGYYADVRDKDGRSENIFFTVDEYVEPHLVGDTLWLDSKYYQAAYLEGDTSDSFKRLDVNSSNPDVISFFFYNADYRDNIYGYYLVPNKAGTSKITLHYTDDQGAEKYSSADFTVKPYPVFADFTVNGETFDAGTHKDVYSVTNYKGTETSVKISTRPGWTVKEAYYYIFNKEDSDAPENTIWLDKEDYEKANQFAFPENAFRQHMVLTFVNEEGEDIDYRIDFTRGSEPYDISYGEPTGHYGTEEGSGSSTGEAGESTVIAGTPEVTLSPTNFTYKYAVKKVKVGKKKKKQAVATVQVPTVSSVMLDGKKLTANDYEVSFSNAKSGAIGKYTATVTLKGDYKGTGTATYSINPKPAKISKLAKGKKKMTVKWKKAAKNDITYKALDGYEIQYSLSPDFSSADTKTTTASRKAASKAIKKLQSKQTYYVRVRTYKSAGGAKLYSNWSAVKSVKVK